MCWCVLVSEMRCSSCWRVSRTTFSDGYPCLGGAQPQREALPDVFTAAEREHLQDAKRDPRDVDEAFVGFNLARHRVAILCPRSMQELVAGALAAARSPSCDTSRPALVYFFNFVYITA